MNTFIGIGRIIGVESNDKVLKFTFSVQQESPCVIPCVLFYPKEEAKQHIEQLFGSNQLVWLQGRITVSEYESHGRTFRNVEIVTYANSIKAI
jgi:hypothetical protein